MTLDTNMGKTKRIIGFSILFLATISIASFVIATLFQEDKTISEVKPASHVIEHADRSAVLVQDKLLKVRFGDLFELDQKYADALMHGNDKGYVDSMSKRIVELERDLHASVDSVVFDGGGKTGNDVNQIFSNAMDLYKDILQGRNALGILRSAATIGNTGLKPVELDAMKTQVEIQQKNIRIAQLENELKVIGAKMLAKQPYENNDEEMKSLNENIIGQQNQISNLTAKVGSLKEENEKLAKEKDILKGGAVDAAALKIKSAGLQQTVDELNAELRLAQVDCNLSRVDAAQIISNSKQRKQLLSEASGILSSLSNSQDPEIKKKAQYKILKLNQIAANSRD